MDNQSPEPPKFNMPQQAAPPPDKVPDAPLPADSRDVKPPKGKNNKKIITIIIAIIIILLGGAAAWYFIIRDSGASSDGDTQREESSESPVSRIVSLGAPDTVPYAFKPSDDTPYSLFWRDASGGDRTEVGPLADKSYVSQSAVTGQNVAYAVENENQGTGASAVWLSTDAGKSYQNILDLKSGDQVTSMIFSPDGDGLAVAVIGEDAQSNEVILLDSSTGEKVGSFTSSQRGVFLEGYNVARSEVMYYEGCYNCDGNTFSKLQKTNFKSNSTETVVDTQGAVNLETVIRSDFSEALIVSGSMVEGTDGLGGQQVSAPYSIKGVDLLSGEISSLATVGAEGDAGRLSGVGYMADGITPYYAYGSTIGSIKGGAVSTIYESDEPILAMLYVSSEAAVVSTGDFADYSLFRIDFKDNSKKLILEGDGNATIFGVTTKQT